MSGTHTNQSCSSWPPIMPPGQFYTELNRRETGQALAVEPKQQFWKTGREHLTSPPISMLLLSSASQEQSQAKQTTFHSRSPLCH